MGSDLRLWCSSSLHGWVLRCLFICFVWLGCLFVGGLVGVCVFSFDVSCADDGFGFGICYLVYFGGWLVFSLCRF